MQQTDKNVLMFANKATELCCGFGKNITIPVPTIKVIGGQSAGKSTLIVRMIGYDILPTGDSMVTRTPLYIRMHNVADPNIVKIKLSYLKNGALVMEKQIEFSNTDSDKQLKMNEFKRAIVDLTDKVTTGKYVIAKTQLFVDIESNKVSNFSFVDLPGIVMTACTDKGQTTELPEQIRSLLREELSVPNTIALVVVKTGNDLETDLGIGLINEVRSMNGNKSNFATIGVLTKPDLLDTTTRNSLNNLIAGKMINKDENLSSSLTMSEGFFVVNNTCSSLADEQAYFTNNFDQSREIITEKRYCVGYLQSHLQSLLATSVRKLMPSIKTNLEDILKGQRQKSQYLGIELKTDQDKMSYFMTTVFQLNRLMRDTINSYGSSQNVGLKIKQSQDVFLSKMDELDPFKTLKDEYFEEIIYSFEGYHLTSHATIEQLADRCIKDETKKPVTLILPLCEELISNVVGVLNDNIRIILECEEVAGLSSYPKLKSIINQALTGKVKEYGQQVLAEVRDHLITHGTFLWSTDVQFKKTLTEQFLPKPAEEEEKKQETRMGFNVTSSVKTTYKKPAVGKGGLSQYSYKASQIRELTSKYYETIVASVRDFVIKVVIRKIVNELENKTADELNALQTNLNTNQSITNFIVEAESCATKRATINNNIAKLEEAIALANRYE